jgi:7-carboxy-7-deazaguanine synthase
MPLEITEIFCSIQGESSWSGRPCTFVRLTGCNLRCAFCDTAYAYGNGRFMEVTEAEEQVRRLRCGLVEITGGEPLLQAETPALAERLLDTGHAVLVETNGSIDIDIVDSRCVRIVDMKCPSSGMAGHNDLGNLKKLKERDELKFVIGTREDYEFAKELLSAFPARLCGVNFSPVFGLLSPRILAGWILEERLPVRLNLQLHKLIQMP